MKSFQIKNRLIGEDAPVYIIAEMSANHAGSLERAKEIIHAAAESGADCIKIQTYTQDTITIDCNKPCFQITGGTWKDETLYSLYGKAYTPWDWQPLLKEEAEKAGLDFLSTPFDYSAVDFLDELGVDFYKIASFEAVDLPLIKYTASKGKPVIISTGMCSLAEIEDAVSVVHAAGNEQLALLRCASAYPAVGEDMNLLTICDMKEHFGVPVGLSDHSMGFVGAVCATALGAQIIEKHFCISREIENPDSSFSMEPAEFNEMVLAVRDAEKARGSIHYGATADEEANMRFRRSLFAVKDIAEGERFTPDNIRSIRPADGLEPKHYEEILGRTASGPIERGTPLTWDLIT